MISLLKTWTASRAACRAEAAREKPAMSLQIRPIRDSADDLARCLEIYNYYIENTVITFEETPLSAEAWADRVRRIRDAYPFLVAEEDGVIVGYAYLDSYNSRSAYRYTADCSIYLDPAVRTHGIGTRLLQAIEQEAVQRGFKNLVSIITEGNLPSLRFHEKNGFLFRGRLERVGLKFGRWLDVAFYQKSL